MSGFLMLVGIVVLIILFFIALSGIRYIPNNRIGLVEKRWSLRGSVKGGLIALHGEAGYQPQVLRGGLHYLMPIQYVVHMMPLVTISQGKIGYIFARDGKPLEPTQVLASNVDASDFQDVEGFLKNGGNADRSAASCVKARMPSTWCSSWSSPKDASIPCRSAGKMQP